MNLKKLKEKFIAKKFQKKLNIAINNREISDKIIVSVAILITEEISSIIDIQKEVEKKLNVRNCKIFKFRPFNKLNDVSFEHFSDKDVNWQGKIDNVNLQSFLDQSFDLLISFYDKKNLYLEYATLQSKAKFKVGFTNINQSLFDVEIASRAEEYSIFLSELNTYLKILKKL